MQSSENAYEGVLGMSANGSPFVSVRNGGETDIDDAGGPATHDPCSGLAYLRQGYWP